MQTELKNQAELSVLLECYNYEIDQLKSKLLNGISWEELTPVRRKITELAIAIHKFHNCAITHSMSSEVESLE